MLTLNKEFGERNLKNGQRGVIENPFLFEQNI